MSDPLSPFPFFTPAPPAQPQPPAAAAATELSEAPPGFFEPDLVENRELAQLLTDNASSITAALEISKDPQDTLDRVTNAAWMAHRTGLPFSYTMENYDSVALNYWGQIRPPKSDRQVIYEAWKSSSQRQKIYTAQAQRLFGQGSPELDEQVKEWKRQLPTPDDEARPWHVELFKAAADLLPYQWEATKFSAPIALASAGISAALGAAAGPGAGFSIPAAAVSGFLRGMSLGSKAYTFMSEAGATFDTLLDIGVDEGMARAIAIPIGAGKAAIESVQLANIPGLSTLKRQLLEHAVARDLSKELLEKGLISRIVNAAAAKARGPLGKGLVAFGVEYGLKGLGVEPATEVAQESLDMFAEAAGKAWMKAAKDMDIPQATAKESWTRIWETWKQTAMAMVVTGLPGSTMTALKATGKAAVEQGAKSKALAAPSPQPMVPTDEVGPGVKLTEEGPATTPAAAEGLQTSANVPAEGKIYRMFEAPALHSITITNEEGSQTYGRMEVRSDDRSADILTLQIAPGQESFARSSILKLMQENAGKQIHWNPADAAGIALRQELISKNPRRLELEISIDSLSEAHEQQKANLSTAADEAARTAIAADMGRLEAEIDRIRRKTKLVGLQWYTEADLTEESKVAQVEQTPEVSPEDAWRLSRTEYAKVASEVSQTEADRALFASPARRFLASAFSGWNRGEVDVAGTLIDLRAQALGLSTEAWMNKYLAPDVFKRWQGSFLPAEIFAKISPDAFTLNQAKRAATEFLEDGRALLHLSEKADFTSLVHELAHIFRRQLPDADAALAAQWAGAAEGWTRDAEEKWAGGLEDYIRDGNTPTPELANIFQRFAEWLKRIYQAVSAHVELSPEIRRVYDRLFAVEEETTSQAAEQKQPSVLFQPGQSAETPSSRLNRLVESAPVVITTPQQWQEADLPTLRKLAREEYGKLEPVRNADSERTVRFVRTGFKELQRHSAARSIMNIVPRMGEVAQKAILLWDAPDRKGRADIKAWHNFGARAVLDGQDVFVHFVAWEEHKELFVDLFRDASVTEAEKVRGLLQPAIPLPMQATAETSPAELSRAADLFPNQEPPETASTRDKLLHWIRAVKSGELTDTTAQTRRALAEPAFRDWFAGSQAVDEQGRPRVFYHGTYSNFSTFEQTRDLGYHFGSSEQAATRIGGEAAREGARIIPVYLSIKNPLRLSQDIFSRFETLPLAEAADILSRDAALSADQASSLHQMAEHVMKLGDTLGPADSRYQDDLERFWDQAKRELAARGFDGVVYQNAIEGAGESWIAFESNQVKSVFNKGTWSQSPTILFQKGPEEGQGEVEPAPVDAKSAEEHQAATQEAVVAGEAVPQEVLEEYRDTEWAKKELETRTRLIADAKTLDTFDEFTDYANAMATTDEAVHATEYLSMIWDQAKNEQTVDRRTANEQFLKSLTKEHLAELLRQAAEKNMLGGLHKVMAGVAMRVRRGGPMSDVSFVRIMAQINDDPTRYRALFADITGDEAAIRQLIEEQKKPQKESLEERIRRENRQLRQQVKTEQAKATAAARMARLEHEYSNEMDRQIRKIQAEHEEKLAKMKLEAAEKLKAKTAQKAEVGRGQIRRLRDQQALSRQKQKANRKVREGFNSKIRKLEKVMKDIPHMHPDAKAPLTALLEDILLERTSPQRKLRLQEIQAAFESNPEYEIPDNWKVTLSELDKKSVREMNVAEFDTLYNAVMHYAHRNMEIQQQRVGAERMRKDQVLTKAKAELRKVKPLPADEFSEEAGPRETEIVGGRGKGKRRIRAVYDTLLGMGQDHYNLIVERIAGPESIIHRLFVREIEEARKVQLAYQQQVHRRFQADIASLGVSNITAWLGELTPVDRFEFTRGERMALWMHAANEDNRDSILHAGFGLRRSEGDKRFHFNDEAELQMVLDTVSDQEKIFTAAAARLFQDQGKALAKVFLEKNGYELALEENYYHKDVMAIGRGSEATVDDALERFKGTFMRIGMQKGMTKTRKGVAVPLYLNNIAHDIEKSVSWAAAYIGFEIPLTQASRLLYDKSFREELSTRFTPRLYKEIEAGLRDIAGGYQEIDATERNLLKVRSGLTMAFLGFNPYSMLKQPLSLGNALPYVKARYLMQGLAETIGRGREVFAQHRANSPLFENRLEVGFTRDIADAARVHSEGRLYGARTASQRWGFLGIKSADAFTVASVMRGAWLQAMGELESGKLSRDVALAMDLQGRSIANLSVEDRNALAYKFADFVSTRTQDQALPEYRASLSRSRWGKFFTMFGSSSNMALNLLRRSIMGVRQGDATAVRRLALSILAVGVMGPAGEAAVNMLRGAVRGAFSGDPPPDEERLRTFIGDYIQNVGGLLFFVRDATNRAINAWQYGPYGTSTDTTNPVAYLVDTLQTTIALGVSAVTEEDFLDRKTKWLRFADQFALTLSMLSQMPLYMPTKGLTRILGEQSQKKRR